MKRSILFALCAGALLAFTACDNAGSTETAPTNAAETTQSPDVPSYVTDETALQYSYNLDTTYQTMDGFGAGFTWYASNTFKNPYKDEILKLLFDDAGLSILRFKTEYRYGSFEQSAKTNKQYYDIASQYAAERGETVKVLYTSWSPSADLKSNNKVNGGATLAKDENGNYRYEDFGTWWAEAVAAYREYGIPVDYVSIQNECDFEASYDGCEFMPTETSKYACYADAYLAVYRAMKEKFGDDIPAMIGPETMTVINGTLKSYMSKIMQEAPESVYAIAHHLYLGGTSTDDPVYCDYDSYILNFLDVNKYATEHNLKAWQTEFYRGTSLQTANIINNSLVYEGVNAYIYWGGVWNAEATDTLTENDLIVVASSMQNFPNEKGYVVCGDYYAVRHFSEFIRPGYIRVDANSTSLKVRTSMFTSPDGSRLVIVLMNNDTAEQKVQIPMTDYNVTGSQIYQSVFTEGFTEDMMYHDLGALTDSNVVTLPAESVTTIVIDGSRK